MPTLPLDTVGLAFGAGLIAAVNPCGFALLPVYLSLFVLDGDPPPRWMAIGRALRATAAMTAGFAGVFIFFGLAVAPAAGSLQRYLPGFTVLFGLLILSAGVWVAAGRRLPTLGLARLTRRSRRREARPVTASVASMTGFGASYAFASLGCTIAPFLAVVVTAFRAGSTVEGMVLFLAYAAGMGLVVGTAAVAIALARTGLVRRLRRAGGVLARAAGALLVVAGGYVAWYGAWELRVLETGAGRDPVVETAGRVQRWLADTIQAAGGGRLLLILLVLVAGGLWWHRSRPTRGPADPPPHRPARTADLAPEEEHR